MRQTPAVAWGTKTCRSPSPCPETKFAASPVMSDSARYGFDAVIPKPASVRDISEAVRKVLSAVPDRYRK